MAHELLRLDGANCSALIEAAIGQPPVWRHFGGHLAQAPLAAAWSAASLRRLPPGSMDRLCGLPLLPGFGNGLATAPALRAHRAGADAVHEFVLQSFEYSQAQVQAQAQTLVLHLVDVPAKLRATLTLRLDAVCNMLTMDTTLHNDGLTPLTVDALAAATVPVPAALQELGSFTGQWAHEFQWQREPVPAAGWLRENRRGRTSHEAPPACFLLASDASEHRGEVLAAQLAWSGNHRFALERCDDGALALQAGEWFGPGEQCLQPGQSLHTPSLHVTWTDAGLNGASANFHEFIRSRVLRWPGNSGVDHGGGNDGNDGNNEHSNGTRNKMRPRPVHLNTWEAVYFDHNEASLRELASVAASIGVERFVLDDGWFPARHHDRAGLGDWWPDPLKYPQGLGPLAAHVNALGMEFGLWVEPEMVNPDSELFRAHADWALQVAGRPLQFGRHQLVLDLARPEVAEYLFNKLNTLLLAHPIAYLKWDMNRDLAQAATLHGRLAYGAQVHALYALWARLRQAHPQLEIESCASGAARADLGVLRHAHRIWTSDNNDAISRVAIQSGAARLFPPEVLGSHVGPAPAHATGRSQSMAFRCAVACFGHMGVETDVRQLSVADGQVLAGWIAFHKAWRGVIHGGRFHQGRTAGGSVWWLAVTPGRALLAVITTTPPDHAHPPMLRLPPMQGTGAWRVRQVQQAGQARARQAKASAWHDALCGPGVASHGDELASIGLPISAMNPESALYFSFENEPSD